MHFMESIKKYIKLYNFQNNDMIKQINGTNLIIKDNLLIYHIQLNIILRQNIPLVLILIVEKEEIK